MANNPQKSQDATDEAVNAIQEAIDASRVRPAAASEAPTPDLFRPNAPTADWDADQEPRHAANDDRANIGQLVQVLHRRPSPTPMIIATVAAAAWAAGGLSTAYLYRGELLELPQGVGFAALIGVTAAIVVPVIFFYVMAHLYSRAQDMRRVGDAMAQVAMRLLQPESEARDQIVNVGQAVRREVAAMGDGIERALARASELEALVHNEVSALERTYSDNEVRMRDLLSELSKQRETLVSQAEHVRNSIASVHLDLSHDISSVGELVADKVGEVSQRVARTLTEKGEHITMALGQVGDSMVDALTDRGSTMLDRLETTSDRATSAITQASDKLSHSLEFKSDHVADEFAEIANRLQQMMNARLDQVAQGFANKSAATVENMADRTQEFTARLTNTGNQLAREVAARADEVNVRLKSTGDNFADLFRQNAEMLAATLNTRGEQVRDLLAARLKSFEDMFSRSGTEITEKIGRDTSSLGSLITRHVTEFDHTVKTYGGELVERLGKRTQDVSEAMRNYLDSFDTRVTGRSDELRATLDKRLTQFESSLGDKVGELAKTLSEGGKDVVSALDRRINEAGGVITARGTDVANAIAAKIGEMDRTLGVQAREVADSLNNSVGRMEQATLSIKTNAGDAEKALGTLALSTVEAVRGATGEAEQALTGLSQEVARAITGKAEEISNAVTQRTREMEAVLSEKHGGVLTAITEKGQQFASDISRATQEAILSIEQKGFAFTRTMLDNSNEISRLINSAGETATGAVTRTMNELNEAAQKAITQSKETSTATVREMMDTHNMLRTDTTALFERLREANLMLHEVLSGSHENMSALENTLMLRVSEFVSAMQEVTGSTTDVTDRVERNITAFRDITAQAIGDLGRLAGQFEVHGRDLTEAVNLIERSNTRTEATVGERRVQLDSLISTLDIRTEDLDKRLQRFSALLDESLEAASNRARDVASIVSEASAEGSRSIAEQFERVRENAEDERRRASETMRAIYEQTSGDTQAIFREANERFAEAVQGMKQMALEMQRELESTRGELRRGVFDLPQETAEAAAQMRRVIVDQIEALAELNRIVARHGRNLDAVEPVAQPRRQREEVAPTLTLVGGRGEAIVPPPASFQRAEPHRAEMPMRPQQRPQEPAAFAPRRAEPPASHPPAGRGWLSDLLNRASRDEEPAREFQREPTREPREMPREVPRLPEDRPARHSIESLDSLSVDIARMIDHDAAADLWDRYKRGDRNVFTRRLYTLQGQQAFDEIRKKYRSDREFHQTVDRYIGEFERLLEEVARDDRGQVVARTYLTSETGKVYTMLAHAAGRFEEGR